MAIGAHRCTHGVLCLPQPAPGQWRGPPRSLFWGRLPQMWRAERWAGGAEVVNVPQQIYEYPSILRKWVSKERPHNILRCATLSIGRSSTVSFRWRLKAHKKSIQKLSASFWRCDDGQEAGVRGEHGADQNRLTLSRVNRGTLFDVFTALLLPHRSTLKPKEWHPMGNFCFSGIDNLRRILFGT